MPKRDDLRKILIIGAGPIVIGQGCEFDYSGVQACKALKSLGYEIVLVNSNPATIMTDPDMADHIYIEPINAESITEIIRIERPQAILSTMGGQTALNCAMQLDADGVLAKYKVQLLGANRAAIEKAEDRSQFCQLMQRLGLETAHSQVVNTMEAAMRVQEQIGFPIIIRPSFTLGGSGSGIAYNFEEFQRICQQGLELSLNKQLLLEESLLGWKEFELEVIRDRNDCCIIVCTIENIDPMGIHTGDSITVAPAQTLTDREYQVMRDAAFAILRAVGVETGGSNVQFAVHPTTGRMVVVEMNPRVSRSSALASKATGFPIAKVAALLAVGFTLDELQNDITGGVIPASFEPAIDYVVVKIPRFNFEKFAIDRPRLTTQMQSVGEVMAIGSTFAMALQKAFYSLELELSGLNPQVNLYGADASNSIVTHLKTAGPLRLLHVADAFRAGFTAETIHEHTAIDPWFLYEIQSIVNEEKVISSKKLDEISHDELVVWKQLGFSDARIAQLIGIDVDQLREFRINKKIKPKFKNIDSCAAEFPSQSAYLYAGYDGECEALLDTKPKVIVLGSGPNRIGQGIEFDYCCVQAVQALQQHNIEAVMINCNPETVSTDYDISDRLYFEPIILERVLDIIDLEKPLGVILQFGGQTPLKLASELHSRGINILGTCYDMIDVAEDREKFAKVIAKLDLQQPSNAVAVAKSITEAIEHANTIGYPIIARPSYVLGGRSMQIVHDEDELHKYLLKLFADNSISSVLIDRFLQDATELDVDLVADKKGAALIVGMLEHIEPAGVHSGDSAACMPPHSVSTSILEQIKRQAILLAKELQVVGLMNVQFAIKGDNVYVLEVNPRASRTIPFISKSTNTNVVKIAVACMLGSSLEELHIPAINLSYDYAIKQSVFPFIKFPGFDPILGPEMRSTGEIMAFGQTFAEAYAKSLEAIGVSEHATKCCYINVCQEDQMNVVSVAQLLVGQGYEIIAPESLATRFISSGIKCKKVNDPENVLNQIADKKISLVINTVYSSFDNSMASNIRAKAVQHKVHCITTLAAARAWLAATYQRGNRIAYKLPKRHQAEYA